MPLIAHVTRLFLGDASTLLPSRIPGPQIPSKSRDGVDGTRMLPRYCIQKATASLALSSLGVPQGFSFLLCFVVSHLASWGYGG